MDEPSNKRNHQNRHTVPRPRTELASVGYAVSVKPACRFGTGWASARSGPGMSWIAPILPMLNKKGR